MRNILLVTDLSDAALAGTLEAAKQASSQQARLILVYNFIPEPETEATANSEDNTQLLVPERAIQQKLDALAQQLFLTYGTSISRFIKPGLQPADLALLATQFNAEQVLQFTAANQPEMPVSLA